MLNNLPFRVPTVYIGEVPAVTSYNTQGAKGTKVPELGKINIAFDLFFDIFILNYLGVYDDNDGNRMIVMTMMARIMMTRIMMTMMTTG